MASADRLDQLRAAYKDSVAGTTGLWEESAPSAAALRASEALAEMWAIHEDDCKSHAEPGSLFEDMIFRTAAYEAVIDVLSSDPNMAVDVGDLDAAAEEGMRTPGEFYLRLVKSTSAQWILTFKNGHA